MQIPLKILIMGLPGAGKTTLALALAPKLNAVVFNADVVRSTVNSGLGFGASDRVEHARRMGCMCDIVNQSGFNAIADFVCPTIDARAAFNPKFVVWVDRIKLGRYEDTNQLFQPPEHCHVRVGPEESVDYWADYVMRHLQA